MLLGSKDMDLEILTGNEGSAVFRLVVFSPQAFQICRHSSLSVRIQLGERHLRWPKVGPKELHNLGWRKRISKIAVYSRALDLLCPVCKALSYDTLISPHGRRGNAGRRRNVFCAEREHFAHEARRCPVSHGDRSSRATNAEQLRCNPLRTWS